MAGKAIHRIILPSVVSAHRFCATRQNGLQQGLRARGGLLWCTNTPWPLCALDKKMGLPGQACPMARHFIAIHADFHHFGADNKPFVAPPWIRYVR